ncbi:MAG: inositol monophosphatase [Chitinivibrionales bacterium]|nr:inositol monophosphatase [Chitinivibrionales bacterium]
MTIYYVPEPHRWRFAGTDSMSNIRQGCCVIPRFGLFKSYFSIFSTQGELYIMTGNMKKILTTACRAAREAGAIVMKYYSGPTVRYKGSNDPVTQADLGSQKKIITVIQEEFPHHHFLKEEGGDNDDLLSEHLWIIDPLDGTKNYVGGFPHFGISIACAEKGVLIAGVVYDPVRDELFSACAQEQARLNGKIIHPSETAELKHALLATGFSTNRGIPMKKTMHVMEKLLSKNIRGIRRTGSAALDLCWVACGRLDAYFEYSLNIWDFAAGACIARQSGAVCTNRTGSKLRLDSPGVIAANKRLVARVKRNVAWKM